MSRKDSKSVGRRTVSLVTGLLVGLMTTAASGWLQAAELNSAAGVKKVRLKNGKEAYEVNGMLVQEKDTQEVTGFLVSEAERLPVLSEVAQRGIPAQDILYATITGSEPGGPFDILAQGLSDLVASCQISTEKKNGDVVTVDSVEVWVGGYQHEDKNTEAIVLYVANLSSQEQQLIGAVVGDQYGTGQGQEPVSFGGDFLPDQTLAAVMSAAVARLGTRGTAVARAVADGEAMVKAQGAAGCGRGFKECFKQCLKDSGIPLGFLAIMCAVGVAVACIPTTAGYVACLAAGLALCGLDAVAGIIIGCALGCLGWGTS